MDTKDGLARRQAGVGTIVMTIALMIDLRADTGKTTITAELRKHETMIGQVAGPIIVGGGAVMADPMTDMSVPFLGPAIVALLHHAGVLLLAACPTLVGR